jgi:hypothetical protein
MPKYKSPYNANQRIISVWGHDRTEDHMITRRQALLILCVKLKPSQPNIDNVIHNQNRPPELRHKHYAFRLHCVFLCNLQQPKRNLTTFLPTTVVLQANVKLRRFTPSAPTTHYGVGDKCSRLLVRVKISASPFTPRPLLGSAQSPV